MVEAKLQNHAYRYVESELYAYPYRKREIERLRAEILHPFDEDPDDPTIVKGANSARQPGDPTGRKAVALASHAKLLHLERMQDAIEQVYESLPEVKQELIRVKYWSKPQRLTTIGICEELGISPATYRRWKSQFIHVIAEIMGLN